MYVYVNVWRCISNVIKGGKDMERLNEIKEILHRVNTDPLFDENIKGTLEEHGVSEDDFRRWVDIAKKIYESEE